MKDLIIVGAGNAAREILQIAKDINEVKPTWHIKGFIADTGLDIKKLTNGDFDVIGTIAEWQPTENEVFVPAIADPKSRELVVNKLLKKNAIFVRLMHPTAMISDYCTLGDGVILYPYASIGPNAFLGNFVFLQRTSIAHDTTIGDFSTISSLCGILGGAKLEKRVFIGNHATILPGVSIGEDSYVGAGSVVLKNVEKGAKVFGNPAKRIN